jgi:hypothetical protein
LAFDGIQTICGHGYDRAKQAAAKIVGPMYCKGLLIRRLPLAAIASRMTAFFAA